MGVPGGAGLSRMSLGAWCENEGVGVRGAGCAVDIAQLRRRIFAFFLWSIRGMHT